MAGVLRSAASSESGPVRRGNEDAFVIDDVRGVYAVIDGMGGMGNGDRAAEIARDELSTGNDLRASLRRANRRIRDESSARPGMGCVVTALRVQGSEVRVLHLGDTRALLVSDAGCERLTRDHTVLAAAQEREGLSDGDTRALSGRNIVTRDLGGADPDDPTWPDEVLAEVRDGDLLVLLTDGVHGSIPADDLHALLRAARRERREPDAVARHLLRVAYERGSTDNATAVVIVAYPSASRSRPSSKPSRQRQIPTLLVAGHVLAFFAGFALGRSGREPVSVGRPVVPEPTEQGTLTAATDAGDTPAAPAQVIDPSSPSAAPVPQDSTAEGPAP
jgi:protein phosphatase